MTKMSKEEKEEAYRIKWARCESVHCPYLVKTVEDEETKFNCSNEARMLARIYLDAQQFRIGSCSRIEKLGKEKVEEFNDINLEMHGLEKHIVKLFREKTKGHLLWDWSENVKGLGDVGVLTFMGYICPYIADTAGKAKAYLGLTPDHGLKNGQNHKVNFEAKGRFFGVVLNGVIMAKDPTYYTYYLKQKEYYAQIPKYALEQAENVAKYKAKHPNSKLDVKGTNHIDRLAKRKTLSLLVSHGTELMRQNEGLDTSAFKAHHGYIAPSL
jgi:hypothetical protein